jgi:hypothetical protein
MNFRSIPLFETGNGREELKRRCREEKVPLAVVEALVEAELEQVGKERKRGMWEKFDEILSPHTSSGSSGQER